jgi:hypothetical protein
LGERRFCTPEVAGSTPVSSTIFHGQKLGKISPSFGERINSKKIFENLKSGKFFVLTKLYGQVTKSIRGMPRCRKVMKDVASCDKLRGVAKQALIRGFPNGETHADKLGISSSESIG